MMSANLDRVAADLDFIRRLGTLGPERNRNLARAAAELREVPALRQELHALRAEVARLRRGRDADLPQVVSPALA